MKPQMIVLHEHTGWQKPLFDALNSNLTAAIGRAFGLDPFERVVDFLLGELALLDGEPR